MTEEIEVEVYNEDESALRPGTLLCGGKYRIVKKLGQGGFGITYLGEQIALNRRVAIKEYYQKDLCERSSSSTNITLGTTENRKMWDMFLKKFIKEAQAIAQFESTNIVKIYDIFSENGTAYYVMEYIDGGSLEDLISRRGRLTKVEAYDIITQLANALGYVHSRNRLHLDVKPGNVLMRGGKEVVLIDFGISKYYNETGRETSRTPPGVSAGYSPVEQYHQGGVSNFSPSTDIYALGATLYKMLTGIRPPESTELAYQGFDILDIPSYIDRVTELVITKTMQQIGSNRPQSVSEFLALLGGGKKGTDDRTKVESEDTEVKGSRAKVVPAPPAPTPPPGPRPPRSTLQAILVGALVAIVVGVGVYLFTRQLGTGSGSGGVTPPDTVVVDTTAVVEQPETASVSEYVELALQGPSDSGSGSVNQADEEPTGSINVTCGPKGATIKVDGTKVGTTPKEIEGLSVGRHTVEVSKSGYESRSWTVNVKANGTEYLSEDLTEKPLTSAKSGTINGYDYVNLGLSVKWATCNVGASSPSGYGNYYAWGETSTKSTYTSENSKTYGNSSYNYDIGGKSSLDAARANWGGTWRLPTKAEFQELIDKCTWTWTTQGGHNGYRVTGPNGNSIFLPAAGYRGESLYNVVSSGYYWTSSPLESDSNYAFYLYFYSGYHNVYNFYRYWGYTVRPVSE